MATKKEKINRLSCAPPEPLCWKPRAPRCLVELVHSRHTRFPEEARAGGEGSIVQYSTWPPCVETTGSENTCARQSSSKGAPKSRKAVRSHSARCEAVQRERLRHAQLLLVISLKFPAHVPLKFVSKLLRKKMSTNCLQSSFWTCLCTLTLSLVEFTFGSNSNCCQCFINAPFAFPFKMKHFTLNIPCEGTQKH
jgi:hypothetical protein